MDNNLTIQCKKTQSGFPTLWEKGGKGEHITLVASSHGGQKNVIYQTRPSAKTKNGRHALFIVDERDLLAFGQLTGEEQYLNFYRIVRIYQSKAADEMTAILEQLPDREVLRKARTFYDASVAKLQCEGCTHIHYGNSRY